MYKLENVDIKGNVLVFTYYEGKESITEIKCIKWDAFVLGGYDFEYGYKKIESGNYPILAVLPEYEKYDDFQKQYICHFRDTIKIYLGDSIESVNKALRKVVFTPNVVESKTKDIKYPRYKIIDIEAKGHLLKIYLGNIKDKDYHGCDWDKKYYYSYPVNNEYIKKIIYMQLDVNNEVEEPKQNPRLDRITKYELKDGKVPIISTYRNNIQYDSNRHSIDKIKMNSFYLEGKI